MSLLQRFLVIDGHAYSEGRHLGRMHRIMAFSASSSPADISDQAVLVGIIMGSQSDWDTMRHASQTLERLGVSHECRIVSAHRTPDRLCAYAKAARERGLQVIIAGAGGAAHLPGMVAAMTVLPVLGVPVESHALRGMDSLLSIVQMPGGIPVGTLAIGKAGAINAALLAGAILALHDRAIADAVMQFRQAQTDGVAEMPQTEEFDRKPV